MCGICGIVDIAEGNRLAGGERSRVVAMLHAMRHRGPDGAACLARGAAVMAANRLAIRELDALQPPLLEYDDGVIVACNGEIDNHRELRRMLAARGRGGLPATDVGVIAPLYLEQGAGFLEALRGVFALALWDPRRQRLVLARDRAGERHLFYAVAGSRVAFASEPAALTKALAGPARPDPRALAHYLRSGYCAASSSAIEGIRKVGPGEVIVIDAAGVECRHYWSLPAFRTANPPSGSAFDRVFRDAISRQSDVDVDCGVMLSGGVDSALVTAVLRKIHPAHTFPAYCARFDETSFDEGGVARRVACDLGCEFVPVTVTADDFPRHLRALIAATGELIADPAWIAVSRVAERASQDVRMLFGGEGADELFAGYPTYLGARWASRYKHLPAWTRRLIRRAVEAWPVTDKKIAVSFLLKRFVQTQPEGGMARHVAWTASISPDWLRRLGIEPPGAINEEGPTTLLDAAQRYDFTHLLPEAYLAKADRGAMLHGVEIRTPFLDKEVIEFASVLPVEARVRGLTTKPFLKRYAREYLPGSIVNRRKRGLSVPLSVWLRGPLHEWARSRLGSEGLAQAGVNTGEALALLAEHERRREDHARAIWTLAVLSEWLEWLLRNDPAATVTRPCGHEARGSARPDFGAAELADADTGSRPP